MVENQREHLEGRWEIGKLKGKEKVQLEDIKKVFEQLDTAITQIGGLSGKDLKITMINALSAQLE